MTRNDYQPGSVTRWLTGRGPAAIPRFVWLLWVVAATLGIAYLVDVVLGRPGGSLSHVVDLDGEANLPTWFSSVQWFAVAILTFVAVDARVERGDRRTWALWILPLIFLAFSADEVVKAHEFAGGLTDIVLPGGTREGSALESTGAFAFTIGTPFILLAGAVLLVVRPYLPDATGRLQADHGGTRAVHARGDRISTSCRTS